MTPQTLVTATAVRLGPTLGDPSGNLARSIAAIEGAARGGAALIVLPELVTSGYSFEGEGEARTLAETIPGPASDGWAAAAARLGVVIVGGICEVDPEGRLRNSAVVVDADGTVLCVYRKIHLWGIEKAIFEEGDEPPPVVETAVGRLGVGICYDLWFPELARSLALRGAQILAYPSNLSLSTHQDGMPHLEIVVPVATAHLNRVNLVVADRCTAERGNQWLGAALVVDADGILLDGPPAGDGPSSATGTFDVARADDKGWAAFNDILADRRPGTYQP